MGLYLAQLPPAELARLKAELAETLIEYFCYPRFLDYRTNTLRMRPVDRSKRQEVWSFLSSYDFGPWGRVDVQSPDFQRLVERLLIQFIQRNRAFFGNQGRKRMTDVRTLIGSSSMLVTEGLRGHLTGHKSSQPFGSPRPVVSWASLKVGTDLSWEQVANTTQQIQQQLLELRGDIQAEGDDAPRPYQAPSSRPAAMPAAPPRRSPRNRASSNGSGKVQAVASPTPPNLPASPAPPSRFAQQEGHPVPSTPFVEPSPPPTRTDSTIRHIEEVETVPFTDEPPHNVAGQMSFPQQASHPSPAPRTEPSSPEALPSQVPASMRELSKTPSMSLTGVQGTTGALTKPADNDTIVVSDEDVVIFEQMKYQLLVWLRIEVVRLGIEIADRTPLQLIDLLRDQEGFDDTRLQVVTTLLQLADSVSAKGQAALIDYKQTMMFYLMHTRRAR